MSNLTRNDPSPLKVLEVSASGRRDGSVSRMLTQDIVDALEQRSGSIELTRRDLSTGIPLVDAAWIAANFAPAASRTAEQRAALATSDALVAELRAADAIVVGSPIYNFGIPAALKAWIDMIARARLTFRYTDSGPEGLLRGKKAYLVIASGGVPVDGPLDFATPYLRQALRFVGITDVEVVAADQLNKRYEQSIDSARMQIAESIFTSPPLGHVAAA
jgi:FMN-dependent NADH-azoreductase